MTRHVRGLVGVASCLAVGMMLPGPVARADEPAAPAPIVVTVEQVGSHPDGDRLRDVLAERLGHPVVSLGSPEAASARATVSISFDEEGGAHLFGVGAQGAQHHSNVSRPADAAADDVAWVVDGVAALLESLTTAVRSHSALRAGLLPWGATEDPTRSPAVVSSLALLPWPERGPRMVAPSFERADGLSVPPSHGRLIRR